MTRANDADKLVFSSETRSVLASTLAVPPYYHAGTANRGTAGYIHGGTTQTSDGTGRVYKMPFSTDTFSLLGLLNITAGEAKTSACAYDQRFGILVGGETPGRPDWISSFSYSTETETLLGAKLTSGRRDVIQVEDCGAF